MIQSDIVTPVTLPAFTVAEEAENYWQEAAAYSWLMTLSSMKDAGHKIRQDDLYLGETLQRSLFDYVRPWVVGAGVPALLKTLLENIANKLQFCEEALEDASGHQERIATSAEAMEIKPGLNPETPNLIDDFFSNITVDSDAIKVAMIAIQSLLEGSNVIFDLLTEAIREQAANFTTEDETGIAQILAEVSEKLSVSVGEGGEGVPEVVGLAQILAEVSEKLSASVGEEEDAVIIGLAQIFADMNEVLFDTEEGLFHAFTDVSEAIVDKDEEGHVIGNTITPKETHLHVNTFKGDEDINERWRYDRE